VSISLNEIARRTDETVQCARAELVAAVRHASANGMAQTEIARQIGRSQPEVSRLLKFHGTSPIATRLRQQSSRIRRTLASSGGTNLRVFGSVATGKDHPGSDVDLLFKMSKPLSLMKMAYLEQQISELLGVDVDLVPDSTIRPEYRDRILAEAVAL